MKIANKKNAILCIVLSLILGILVGRDIQKAFVELYLGKMSQPSIRYIIFIFIVYIDYSSFASSNYTSIIFRNKTLLTFLLKCYTRSIKYICIFFVVLHIPIMLFNFNTFFSNLLNFIIYIFNDILISTLIITFIFFIDTKIKNRVFSGSLFIVCFAFIDFIFENYAFHSISDIKFLFNEIFIMPAIYSSYLPFCLVFIGLITLILLLSLKFIRKGDYIIHEKTVEEN